MASVQSFWGFLVILVSFVLIVSKKKYIAKKHFVPINKILHVLQQIQAQMCSMRGTCGYRYQYLPVPCPVHAPPAPVDPDHYSMLTQACPELTAVYGNSLCCDETQIVDLVESMKLPEGLLASCPSCAYNFRQPFCHLVCSPKQAEFFNVTETQMLPSEPWNDDAKLVEAVKVADFYLTRTYAEDTYKSCEHVVFSSTGGPVLDLLCGPYGAGNCTYERLYRYLGSSLNNYAPFDIRFNYKEVGEGNVFDFETIKCNEPSPDGPACNCQDCPASCPSNWTNAVKD